MAIPVARDYTVDWTSPASTADDAGNNDLVILISSDNLRFQMSKTPLRVHSAFFHDMFQDCPPGSEDSVKAGGGPAEIRMSESSKILTPILDYIYRGHYNLPPSCNTLPELQEILRACDKFRILSVPPLLVGNIMYNQHHGVRGVLQALEDASPNMQEVPAVMTILKEFIKWMVQNNSSSTSVKAIETAYANAKAYEKRSERLSSINRLIALFDAHQAIPCTEHDAIESSITALIRYFESKTSSTKFSMVALWEMAELTHWPATKSECSLCRQLFKAHKALIKAVYTAKYGWEEA